MTSLKDKVTKALDETHILVLGTQILLGFGFQATFQPGFERLAPSGRWLAVCVVALLLVAFLFLVAPTPFHRIAEHGDRRSVCTASPARSPQPPCCRSRSRSA